MRSLVLGGSTFVGRRLVHHLTGHGHEVAVLNRGRTPSKLPPDVRRYVADRTDVGCEHAVQRLVDRDRLHRQRSRLGEHVRQRLVDRDQRDRSSGWIRGDGRQRVLATGRSGAKPPRS